MIGLPLLWNLFSDASYIVSGLFSPTCHFCSSDMVYCGVYDNALDNDNYNLAKGFNYHQGPVRIPFLFSEFSGFPHIMSAAHSSLVPSLMESSFPGVAVARWVFPSCKIVFFQIDGARDQRQDDISG